MEVCAFEKGMRAPKRGAQKFYVIYLPAEISHWKRLVTITLEFWKATLASCNKKKSRGLDIAVWIRWVSHGTYSYVRTYMNAVANSVTVQLCLRHDFYNIILKINHKFMYLQGQFSAPGWKFVGAAPGIRGHSDTGLRTSDDHYFLL